MHVNEVRKYRATGLTVDPRNLRYAEAGTVIVAPPGHRYNARAQRLEVPTGEILGTAIVMSTAKRWVPVAEGDR